MKFGIRKPSLKKRISARTSVKRAIRHKAGIKAPRGWGWLTNPKKAAYNRVYNRTSVSVDTVISSKEKKGVTKSPISQGCMGCITKLFLLFIFFVLLVQVIDIFVAE